MKIIAYEKYITSLTTKTLVLPVDTDNQPIGTELATLADGKTYVSMPADAVLPTQSDEISASVAEVTLTADQIAEIKEKSPHVKLINERVIAKIREKYTLDEELKLARIAIGSLQNTYTLSASESQSISDYHIFVEDCRTWGNTEKTNLGL